jgi:hypothetical protein
MSEYVLFYSKDCVHCKEFMNELYKNQDLYKLFHLINVLEENIKLPRYVQSVPTLIINESNSQRPQIKVGNNVFEWYKEKMEQNNKTMIGGIQDWDPSMMNGYSDNFSSLDSTNEKDRNFAYLDMNTSRINTPDAQNSGLKGYENKGGDSRKQAFAKPKSQLNLEKLRAQRAREMPKGFERT